MVALRARRLRLPPDAIAIARGLVAAHAPHVCLLHAAETGTMTRRVSYVTAHPDAASSRLDPWEDEPNLSTVDGPLAGSPRWIGVVPYESQRGLERAERRRLDSRAAPLLSETQWLRFPAVLKVDHDSGDVTVIGESNAAIQRLADQAARPDATGGPAVLFAQDADAPDLHLDRVRRAVDLILAGDLYQVNVARRLDVELQGSWIDGYALLAKRSPSAFGAALDLGAVRVLSSSPELLLRGPVRHHVDATTRWIYTEPIKGTRPRGADAVSDEHHRRDLASDPKERAELAMILDVERNDLGRVARRGSVGIVCPERVVTHRTIHHRKALVAAALRPEVSSRELLEALLPSGSVTGAPKVRAMEVIAELEAHRRGLYTGAIGFASHDRSFTLAMAIRTAVLEGADPRHRGEYFTGGGIVADSVPEREFAETLWKAAQLTSHPSGVTSR